LPALGVDVRPTDVPGLQAAAAVGQSRLMQAYTEAFDARRDGRPGVADAQRARRPDQYLHARQAFERLLSLGVVPIVNENDTVAIEELRLGDNDRLAAMVGHLVGAGLLLLLTDTSGSSPRTRGPTRGHAPGPSNTPMRARRPHAPAGPVHSARVVIEHEDRGGTNGGVVGIPTVIAPADAPDVAISGCVGHDIGTWIEPRSQRLPARKLWIAFGQPSKEGSSSTPERAPPSPTGVRRCSRSASPRWRASSGRGGGGGRRTGRHLVAKGIESVRATELRRRAGHRSEHGEVAIHRDDMIVLTSVAGERFLSASEPENPDVSGRTAGGDANGRHSVIR
jgi:glutamate 5-kinase